VFHLVTHHACPHLQAKVLALRQRFATDSDTALSPPSASPGPQQVADPASSKRVTPGTSGKKLPPPSLPEAVWHELASEVEEVRRPFRPSVRPMRASADGVLPGHVAFAFISSRKARSTRLSVSRSPLWGELARDAGQQRALTRSGAGDELRQLHARESRQHLSTQRIARTPRA